MQGTADKIKKRDNPKDVFYTPIDLVKTHLDYVLPYVKENDIIFDPFYGTGNYYKLFEEYYPNNTYDFTEIEMGKDFFQYDKKVDIIVSNPPYSLIDQVFDKSVSLNPFIISYLIGLHNLTTRRIEKMNEKGYFLVKIKMMKVFKWFGMSAIVIFKKEENGKNCIDFDRKVFK